MAQKTYLNNEQINLRNAEPEDLDIMYQIENDSRLWEVSSITVPYSRYILRQYLETSHCDIFADRQLRLMVELKNSKQVIGAADLTDFDPLHNRTAVGIIIRKEWRERGYGQQTLTLLCEYCFEYLHLKQLYAYISTDNTQSINLFESCGFTISGTLKNWIKANNGYKDVFIMQRTQSLF